MTLGLLLLGLTAGVMVSDWLIAGTVWTLRRVGLLPWPEVKFNGLLQDLHAIWPLEEDECSRDEILADKGDEPETIPLVAEGAKQSVPAIL